MSMPDSLSRGDVQTFLDAAAPPEHPFLTAFRAEAEQDGVPVLSRECERLLAFLTDLIRPKRILEIGTAVGYSATVMALRAPSDCVLDTIENYPSRILAAKETLKTLALSEDSALSSLPERIVLHEGDASAILPALSGPYDRIFMDAAKGQYIRWLPEVLRLLSDRGVLVSDDVLQDGDGLKPRQEVARRDRTIHKRMTEYLQALTQTDTLSSVILNIGDGVALTVKKQPEGGIGRP